MGRTRLADNLLQIKLQLVDVFTQRTGELRPVADQFGGNTGPCLSRRHIPAKPLQRFHRQRLDPGQPGLLQRVGELD